MAKLRDKGKLLWGGMALCILPNLNFTNTYPENKTKNQLKSKVIYTLYNK
jgi:hypothetical protein